MSRRDQRTLTLDFELVRPGAIRTIAARIAAEGPGMWVQFEARLGRYHAVWAAEGGGYWTWCGRFVRVEAVRKESDSPKSRCACCRGRQRLPYLILDNLLAMRGLV